MRDHTTYMWLPTVNLTWHKTKYKVHKLHLQYILKVYSGFECVKGSYSYIPIKGQYSMQQKPRTSNERTVQYAVQYATEAKNLQWKDSTVCNRSQEPPMKGQYSMQQKPRTYNGRTVQYATEAKNLQWKDSTVCNRSQEPTKQWKDSTVCNRSQEPRLQLPGDT